MEGKLFRKQRLDRESIKSSGSIMRYAVYDGYARP